MLGAVRSLDVRDNKATIFLINNGSVLYNICVLLITNANLWAYIKIEIFIYGCL